MSFKILSKKELKKLDAFDKHESVRYIFDEESKLEGYIAIHNTKLGPAVGGTRMFPYKSREQALNDVLLLSRAMTYKCAVADVNFGGGKTVIIGDPLVVKTKGLLKSYALEIDRLKGKFYTGEDVGISEADVQFLLTFSQYFIGKSSKAADPSPFASLSTFYSIKLASKFIFGNESLANKKVAVKGIGKVGGALVDLLVKENSNVFIADLDEKRCLDFKKKYPQLEIKDPNEIHKVEAEIYSPCALGGEFTEKTKLEVKAKVICGAANNQLLKDEIGDWFFHNEVIYIPDYVSNSGGLIDVIDELEAGGYKGKEF